MRRMKKTAVLCMAVICIFAIMAGGVAYAAGPDQAEISIEQVFEENGSTGTDGRFTYQITALNPGNPMPAVTSITLDGSETLLMDPITFTVPGTYKYEVTLSSAPSGAGYTLDSQVYVVTVYVTSSGGTVATAVVIHNESNNKVSQITFVQKYSAKATDPSLMVDPPVKKTLEGTPAKDSIFTFSLTAQNKNQPMPVGSKDGVKLMEIVGSGEEDFGTWSYTQAGSYYYTIAEVNMKENGYTYDTAVYTIADVVKDVDGQLELTRTVTNSAGKPIDSCSFINKYTSTAGVVGSTQGTTGPKTGDDTNLTLMVTLLGISGLLAAVSIFYLVMSKKRKKEEQIKR